MFLAERVSLSFMSAVQLTTTGLSFSYVFDDYSWDRDGPAYSKFNGKLIPSRIPLSAIISGEEQACRLHEVPQIR